MKKKPLSRAKRAALQKARQALKASRRAKRAEGTLKSQGDPVLELARLGVEARDILTELGFLASVGDQENFRATVERGHARYRIALQKLLFQAAKRGRSNAARMLAQAWLDRFQDAREAKEIAGTAAAYKTKILELLAKLNDRSHAHVRENLQRLNGENR